MGIETKLDFDLASFDIEAIKRAAYRCSDRFAFDVTILGNLAACTLIFADGTVPEAIDVTVSNFRKEVLDQDLRQSIRAETEAVRNVILAHVFSRSGLVK